MKTLHLPKNSAVLLLAVLTSLQGCVNISSAPAVPAIAPPLRYQAEVPLESPSTATAWWDALGDPQLTELISRASEGNLDVAAAEARIAAARAFVSQARAATGPKADLRAVSSREQLSTNGLYGAATGSGVFPDTYTLSRIGTDASWELDLFGRNAAERRQAEARHEGTVAELAAIHLSLTAEVATLYIEHVVLARQLASAERQADWQADRVALAEQQEAAGSGNALAVAEARLALKESHRALPRLAAEVAARRHAMGALLGTLDPVPLPDTSPLLGEAMSAVLPDLLPDAGLPSELLRRRPDIAAAEATFHAVAASRDLAIADQYPRFSIVSGFGAESLESGSLLESASRFWNLAPQVALPLFDGGRRKAVVAQRRAELEAAAAGYRQAVIDALADVEQALLRHYGAMRTQDAALGALAEAAELRRLEDARFEGGETVLNDALAARSRFEDRQYVALEAKRQALLTFVTLNKALGGAFPTQAGKTGS